MNDDTRSPGTTTATATGLGPIVQVEAGELDVGLADLGPADLTRLLEIRTRLNDRAPFGGDKQPLWKLSINDFVVKALALALQRVPNANVTWTEAGILKHRTSDVAVAVDGGLYTPVIRSAEAKSLSRISIEMNSSRTAGSFSSSAAVTSFLALR